MALQVLEYSGVPQLKHCRPDSRAVDSLLLSLMCMDWENFTAGEIHR